MSRRPPPPRRLLLRPRSLRPRRGRPARPGSGAVRTIFLVSSKAEAGAEVPRAGPPGEVRTGRRGEGSGTIRRCRSGGRGAPPRLPPRDTYPHGHFNFATGAFVCPPRLLGRNGPRPRPAGPSRPSAPLRPIPAERGAAHVTNGLPRGRARRGTRPATAALCAARRGRERGEPGTA